MSMDAKVLRRAAEIVETPGQWCQGALARDALDLRVEANDPRAAKWCLVGAIKKAQCDVLGPDGWEAGFPEAAIDIADGYQGIWNDKPGRTADEVAAALREAADRCERSEPVSGEAI